MAPRRELYEAEEKTLRVMLAEEEEEKEKERRENERKNQGTGPCSFSIGVCILMLFLPIYFCNFYGMHRFRNKKNGS